MKTVTSRDNPTFKTLKRLATSSRHRHQCGETLLEGVHLLEAWHEAGGAVKQLVVSERGSQTPEIQQWMAVAPSSVLCLPNGLYDEIAATETPSGILGVIDLPPPSTELGSARDTVVLDGVQDPGNVGTLLRTALAAGFSQVVLSQDCAGAWSPKVLRSGQGAHFRLAIHEGISLSDFLAGFEGTVLATALDGSEDLFEAAWLGPVAWVFGSEGQGVRPEVLALARLRIRIPMQGPVESLNVGAAAAVCLFETLRRRR